MSDLREHSHGLGKCSGDYRPGIRLPPVDLCSNRVFSMLGEAADRLRMR
jgi:hypothetical protein